MLKGKGGLLNCPKCGSDLLVDDDEYFFGGDDMTKQVWCEECGATFNETWQCIGWEEEE